MDEPGLSAAGTSSTGSLPSTTTASLPIEDVRRIAQELASIIRDTPTSNPLNSSQTATGDVVSGNFVNSPFGISHMVTNNLQPFIPGPGRRMADSPALPLLRSIILLYLTLYVCPSSHLSKFS